MRLWSIVMILPLMTGPLSPQATVHRASNAADSFEVASVKPSSDCSAVGVPMDTSPGRLALRCVTLRGLIGAASAVVGDRLSARRIEVLGGPAWLNSDRYDISAKAEGNPPRAKMLGPMLQRLLSERFKLSMHKESRDAPAYAMILSGGGIAPRPSKEGSCVPVDLNHPPSGPSMQVGTKLAPCGEKFTGVPPLLIADWHGVTMEEFAAFHLAGFVDRPVVDKTGLTGRYDLHLEFVPERRSRQTAINGEFIGDSPDEGSGPFIFSALTQQLGLKLIRDKGSIDVIIVDHAEKPSAN